MIKHHDINHSSHGVSACQVLINREVPKPEHDCEFRDKQEA